MLLHWHCRHACRSVLLQQAGEARQDIRGLLCGLPGQVQRAAPVHRELPTLGGLQDTDLRCAARFLQGQRKVHRELPALGGLPDLGSSVFPARVSRGTAGTSHGHEVRREVPTPCLQEARWLRGSLSAARMTWFVGCFSLQHPEGVQNHNAWRYLFEVFLAHSCEYDLMTIYIYLRHWRKFPVPFTGGIGAS